ncbi:MAG TPA: long-chain fatty acid--CoA ligase [Acidimicrobiales bacterium]|jgi:fatty-acyl-CoA synthase|nr:long-chain fatty acid--CoA ligase [Acidimicrobiales bacterium]
MQGLMQDVPLSLDVIFNRAEQLWPTKRLLTATPSGMERTTMGAWAARTRRLGGVLDDLGISADGRVATFAWNTARHLELYFAPPCTGRVLHTLNIRLFAEQITYIVNHAEDEVIFADRSLLPLLWPLIDECRPVRHVVVMDDTIGKSDVPPLPDDSRILDYEELLANAHPHGFGVVTDENRAASMCYTSGTTGDPKGVVYSHRSVVLHSIAVLLADLLSVREADVVLPVVPMFHANAWGLCQAAVLAGADVVFPGADLSPQAVANLILNEDVTLAAGVPTIWMGCKPFLAGKEHKLRSIVCGGSAVPKALSEAYRQEVGLPILQAWGMTETSPLATVAWTRRERAGDSDEDLADLRATVGLPAPLVELRIADPDSGETLPWDDKTSGEVQVRGPWIAQRYYNDARGDTQFTDDGWLRTGDVGIVAPDGYVRLVDRTKDLIKSGGEWISSVDLENEIMGHPAVAEAAVIAVPSERWMERPMACIVRKPGESLEADELLAWLEPRVAKWWLPDQVEFIDEVPKTSVGKFSKKTLRDRFADRRVP